MGDQVFFQGHAAPGHLRPRLPRGPADRGPARPLPPGGRARRRASARYPHPRLMPDFWEFPTVSMGLGPLAAIYQARFNRYLQQPRHQGHQRQPRLGVPRRRRDRRAGVARRALDRRARRPRQPDLRRQLQPAAPRRPGARQRQDHPGARVGLPRRRLERDQGHLGPRVGRAAGARRRRRAGPPHGRDARRRVAEVLGRVGRLHPRALLRHGPAAAGPGRGPDRRPDQGAAPRRPRLPQGLRGLRRGRRAHGRPDRDPGPDRQGLDARPGRRGAQHHPPGQEAERAGAARSSATGSSCRSPTSSSRTRPTTTRAPDAPEIHYLQERRAALGGPLPRRVVVTKPLELPAPDGLRRVRCRLRDPGGLDHDGLRPAAAQPAARPGHRRADRADHPRRGTHLRHGPAVQGGRHLLRARPAVRPGRLQPGALVPRGDGRPGAGGGHHGGRLDRPRSRPPARPTRRTPSR